MNLFFNFLEILKIKHDMYIHIYKSIITNILMNMQINYDITLAEFNPKYYNELQRSYLNFKTENSKDVPIKLIIFAKESIPRIDSVLKLSKYLRSIKTALLVEKSVFEFALVSIILGKLEHTNVKAIYDDKLSEILLNINEQSYLKNKTLLKSIEDKSIEPDLVAFLSPEQMHPEKWADIMKQKKFIEDAISNIATSDLYTCRRCGEKKSKITELQTRSADEPQTIFITCLACGNAFRKNG